MTKRLISLIVVISILLVPAAMVSAAGSRYVTPEKPIRVFVRSDLVNLIYPVLLDVEKGRTLYPFRELLEYIGAEVAWDNVSRTAIAKYNDIELAFPIDVSYYYVNGEQQMMDTKAIIVEDLGRTYIPIRYAFEAFGFDVDWIETPIQNEIRVSDLKPYVELSDEEFLEKYYNWDHTSNFHYRLDTENKRVIFRNEFYEPTFENYEPEDSLNPDLHRQLYELVKVLCMDDMYVFMTYAPQLGEIDSRIIIRYAYDYASALEGFDFFTFIFAEDELFRPGYAWDNDKFSDNAFMRFDMGKLWFRDSGGSYTELKYEQKLKDCMAALFGEETGKKVYKYMLDEYLKNRNRGIREPISFQGNAIIDNVQVDLCIDNNSTLKFYYTYLK